MQAVIKGSKEISLTVCSMLVPLGSRTSVSHASEIIFPSSVLGAGAPSKYLGIQAIVTCLKSH